jgi:hypothetical protein
MGPDEAAAKKQHEEVKASMAGVFREAGVVQRG